MGLVLLVRHGQASFGAADYDVLSATGVTQAEQLGRVLASQDVVPGALVHGAMRRQRDTATSLAAGAGWAVAPELDEGWNEFGHLAVVDRYVAAGGASPAPDDRRGFQRVFEEATARWTGGAHDAEYDEPWPAFLARTREALERACASDGMTVVVSSGGPIAAACAVLVEPTAAPVEVARLWGSFNTVLANASVTRVLVGSTGRRLLSFNEHSYLPRSLLTYR
jgi:broad specificity phosphatase PhoE